VGGGGGHRQFIAPKVPALPSGTKSQNHVCPVYCRLFCVLFVLCRSVCFLFCVVLCVVCFVSFCVLFVCKCVLYYCQRVATQLQLTNISYRIYTIKQCENRPAFLSAALRYPKKTSFFLNFFIEASQALPACPSDKSCMKTKTSLGLCWNDRDRG
jgi:hypothetical protein